MSITFLTAGAVTVLFSLTLYQKIRELRLLAILVFLIGTALVAVGIKPELVGVTIPIRMRIVMLVISVFILLTTLEAVRRTSLKERYALLWVMTGGIFFVLGLYPNLIELLVKVTGMHYISAIVVIVFSFLILLAFHISLVLSRNEDDRRAMSQSIALLQRRIENLEASSNKSEDAQP